MLALGTLVSAGGAGMWVRSLGWLDHGGYGHGWFAEPAPRESMWRFVAGRVFVTSNSGVLLLGVSRYTSYSSDRAGLSQWETYGGWEGSSMQGVHLRADRVVAWRWGSLTDWQAGGLGVIEQSRQGEDAQIVSLPWSMVIGAGGVPAAWVAWRRRRRARRLAAGQCLRCGYALGPADEQGMRRCSECGRAETAKLPSDPATK